MANEMKVMERPYTKEEMLEVMDEYGYLEGNIALDLGTIIDCDLEAFLDVISEKLVNNCCLMEVNYTLIGADDNGNVILKVSGDASEVVEMD